MQHNTTKTNFRDKTQAKWEQSRLKTWFLTPKLTFSHNMFTFAQQNCKFMFFAQPTNLLINTGIHLLKAKRT